MPRICGCIFRRRAYSIPHAAGNSSKDATMATDTAQPPPAPAAAPDLKILWIRLALFMAVVGVLGSLHLSIQMGLRACPLCYYQRAFMMATAGILAFCMFMPGVPTAALTVFALTPAFAGCAIAAYHCYLVANGALECPPGITGLATPFESLIVFVLLVAPLLGDLFHRGVFVMQ